MQPLVILGVGGFGREVHELVEDINQWVPTFDVLGFLDGNPDTHGSHIHGLPVLGYIEWLERNPGTAVALGIGSPATKARLVSEIRDVGAMFPTLVHPKALVGRRTSIGEGTVICAGTIVTTDLSIGAFNTININVTIGHDAKLGDFATVAPGVHISGHVEIGEGTDLGTGSTIIQGITIGAWSVVGAGASVVKPLPANVTAVGVPARVIKEREPGWQQS
jgi:sugar O-acyltransferase (sialic acid O-acetyltransferase NeuD family)